MSGAGAGDDVSAITQAYRRTHLLEAFEHAEPGTEYVIAKHRIGSLNLRQQFERIIARAGLLC